jgi:outer membrane protein
MTFHFSRFVPVVVAVLSIATFAQTKSTPTASSTSSAAPVTAATAPAAPGRIGIVDIQTAIVGTNEGQRDFEALRKKFEPKSNELEALRREVEELKKQLSTTGDKLNEDARGNLLKQIDSKQKSLQRNFEDANTDFQAQQNEILTRISQKMREVLMKYAPEHGYSIIFEASPILWATEAVNVTPMLVEAYNSASGVPPQPKALGPGPAGAAAPAANPKPAGGAQKPAR